MYLHVYKVAIPCDSPRVCVCGAGVYMLAQLFPLGVRKQGVLGGVTNIPVAHYQQQHKHRLAVSQLFKRVFICVRV